MQDNVLKKQFSERDIQRVRNLVKGKGGERISHGIGYTKEIEDHVEGDVWEEDNRTWTIKDGIKQNVTKMDKFKKVTVPMFCPTCKGVMDKQLDPFYYKSYGTCVDCRAEFETKLKLEGKWEDYVKDTYNAEIDQAIEEYKAFYKERMEESNMGTVTESGEVERWIGSVNKERAEESYNEVIEYLENLKHK
jgi:hypothetical protein